MMSLRPTHTLALVCADDDDKAAQLALHTLWRCAAEPSAHRLRVLLTTASALQQVAQRVLVKQFQTYRHSSDGGECVAVVAKDALPVDALLFLDRTAANGAWSTASCHVAMLNAPWSNEQQRVAVDADVDSAALTLRCTVLARQVVASDCHFAISHDSYQMACLCAVDAVAAAHLHVATVSLAVSRDGGVWITAVDSVPTFFDERSLANAADPDRMYAVEPVWHGLLAHLSCATAEMPIGQLPTLRQWRAVLGEDWKRSVEDGALPGSHAGFLRLRYDAALIAERGEAIRQVIRDAVDAGFNLDAPTCIVASPGRFRVFMGHTDLPGLGGPTINGATLEELIGVAQCGAASGTVELTNSNSEQFPMNTVDVIGELRRVAGDEALWCGSKTFDPRHWHSYVRSSLAFMLASHRWRGADALARFFDGAGVRIHVGSLGELALSHSGGVSSSSSLTGAVASCVRALSAVPMRLDELTSVDLGEYLLGKMAGCADKTAQMMARRGQLSVVASLPDRFVASMELPSTLAVMMAECDIPRLTTAAGAAYLAQRYAGDDSARAAVERWAQRVMRCNSSRAFRLAVQLLRAALCDAQRTAAAGLTAADVEAVRAVLLTDETPLRELCAGGALAERTLPPQRHALVYRLLKLLPLEAPSGDDTIAVRRAALYGLSEVERGAVYFEQANRADAADTILRLVRTAHDGDRAYVDDRTMQATAWASDARVDVSDAALERLSAACAALRESDTGIAHDCLLHWQPGSFERSLAAVDERADELRRAFNGRAEMRIAAAGLGGTVAIHCYAELVPAVTALLQQWRWSARAVHAGSQTQLFCL